MLYLIVLFVYNINYYYDKERKKVKGNSVCIRVYSIFVIVNVYLYIRYCKRLTASAMNYRVVYPESSALLSVECRKQAIKLTIKTATKIVHNKDLLLMALAAKASSSRLAKILALIVSSKSRTFSVFFKVSLSASNTLILALVGLDRHIKSYKVLASLQTQL